MTKKKTLWKQQLLKVSGDQQTQYRGGLAALFFLSICVMFGSACSTIVTYDPSKPVNFQNPPTKGYWLTAQRELIACETEGAARYMADFGFFHAQCIQLHNIKSREYRVLGRSTRQLKEGSMWLLQVERENARYYVPIPWHDWL